MTWPNPRAPCFLRAVRKYKLFQHPTTMHQITWTARDKDVYQTQLDRSLVTVQVEDEAALRRLVANLEMNE
eukprot:9228357-Pyramimonas_sp.AAC.1